MSLDSCVRRNIRRNLMRPLPVAMLCLLVLLMTPPLGCGGPTCEKVVDHSLEMTIEQLRAQINQMIEVTPEPQRAEVRAVQEKRLAVMTDYMNGATFRGGLVQTCERQRENIDLECMIRAEEPRDFEKCDGHDMLRPVEQ